ncbi:MAG: hypothetical protein ACREO4_09255 [Lysobacter sp.]
MQQQPTMLNRVLRGAVATIFVAAAVLLVITVGAVCWAIWSIVT